jgi:hypothetical protein
MAYERRENVIGNRVRALTLHRLISEDGILKRRVKQMGHLCPDIGGVVLLNPDEDAVRWQFGQGLVRAAASGSPRFATS